MSVSCWGGEQMVIECIGQRSLEGIRTYKHTSKQQHGAILTSRNNALSLLTTLDSELHAQLTYIE